MAEGGSQAEHYAMRLQEAEAIADLVDAGRHDEPATVALEEGDETDEATTTITVTPVVADKSARPDREVMREAHELIAGKVMEGKSSLEWGEKAIRVLARIARALGDVR